MRIGFKGLCYLSLSGRLATWLEVWGRMNDLSIENVHPELVECTLES